MENSILEVKKNEIIEWVKNLDDIETLQEILDLKNENNTSTKVSESSIDDESTVDFDKRFAQGMTGSEILEEVFAHIKPLP